MVLLSTNTYQHNHTSMSMTQNHANKVLIDNWSNSWWRFCMQYEHSNFNSAHRNDSFWVIEVIGNISCEWKTANETIHIYILYYRGKSKKVQVSIKLTGSNHAYSTANHISINHIVFTKMLLSSLHSTSLDKLKSWE